MRVIDCLVCDEPPKLILEEAGVFTYCDSSGEEVQATFFVRCPPKPDDENEYGSVLADRQDALNTQITDMYWKLNGDGCKTIKFKNKLPDPFF